MWTQHGQVLEVTGAGQTNVDTACSGVGRDWSRTNICGHSMVGCWKRLNRTDTCGHSMVRCWKRLEQDRQMWIQHSQLLEEAGAEQTGVDTACTGVARVWSRTDRCGHSMVRCWKRLEQDRQMWTQHGQVLEEIGAGQTYVDTACSGVGRDWSRTDICGHSMLRCW